MGSSKIKILLFDLGGVIINLHVEKTIEAFAKLSGRPEPEVADKYVSATYFQDFEKGQISDEQFREFLRQDLNIRTSDAEIDNAWNAMLGEIPADRIEEIKRLIDKYHCAVLSNTNAIHEKAFHKILEKGYGYTHLNELFHQVHFSHEVQLRKPNEDIYLKVLDIEQTKAHNILFLDDTFPNLLTAEKLGYHTLHIPRNQGFTALLAEKL